MSAEPRLLTVAETADRLGISVRHVRRKIASGELTVVRLSEKLVRVAEPDLNAFIAAHRVSGSRGPKKRTG